MPSMGGVRDAPTPEDWFRSIPGTFTQLYCYCMPTSQSGRYTGGTVVVINGGNGWANDYFLD